MPPKTELPKFKKSGDDVIEITWAGEQKECHKGNGGWKKEDLFDMANVMSVHVTQSWSKMKICEKLAESTDKKLEIK